jgi:hypothetical protein
MSRFRRSLAILTLALALAPLPALAATDQGTGLFTSLWDWLSGVWADAGCIIDPGGCTGGTGADEGCIIDPSGWCAPAPSTDEGCGIDPSGGACPERQ